MALSPSIPCNGDGPVRGLFDKGCQRVQLNGKVELVTLLAAPKQPPKHHRRVCAAATPSTLDAMLRGIFHSNLLAMMQYTMQMCDYMYGYVGG